MQRTSTQRSTRHSPPPPTLPSARTATQDRREPASVTLALATARPGSATDDPPPPNPTPPAARQCTVADLNTQAGAWMSIKRRTQLRSMVQKARPRVRLTRHRRQQPLRELGPPPGYQAHIETAVSPPRLAR